MVTRPPSFCTESDSMVPTYSMIPVNIEISRIALWRGNATAQESGQTPASHVAVNVLQISLDGYVGAELLDACIGQWRLRWQWHVGERYVCLSGKFWRIEEH